MTLPLKSALLAGAAVVALSTAGAGTARADSLFDGPYTGGWVGYHQFHPHPNNKFSDIFGLCTAFCTQTFQNGLGTGFQGGGFLGYGYSYQQFYVGVEGEVSGGTARTGSLPGHNSLGDAEGVAKIKAGLGYGGAARIGYIPLPNWLVYGKVGWAFQDFHVGPSPLFDSTVNGSRTLNGVRYGAGTELALPGTFGMTSILPLVRLEWDHTDYRTKTFLGNNPAAEPQFFRLTPNDDSFRLAIVLKFGAPPPTPPPVAAAPPPPPAPPPPAPPKQFVVYFEFDKSDLTPEGAKVVQDAADAFKQTGSARIAVTGYTDLSGTQRYNLGLSKRRADTVHAALVRDGVPDGVIAEAWRGKENPAVPTPDGVREPRNRRVEIVE